MCISAVDENDEMKTMDKTPKTTLRSEMALRVYEGRAP